MPDYSLRGLGYKGLTGTFCLGGTRAEVTFILHMLQTTTTTTNIPGVPPFHLHEPPKVDAHRSIPLAASQE